MDPKQINNVYLESSSVESFTKNIHYDLKALRKIAQITLEYFKEKHADFIKILDIGIGAGDFTIPIIEYFEKKKIVYHLDCFDISDHMLMKLKDRLNRNPIVNEKVDYIRKDAEEGLLNTYRPQSYDLIIITFVLHYVKNWQRLIQDVNVCLKNGGLFIQAEIIGDMRNVDGKFDTETPTIFENFWKEYFIQREKYARWEPLISVSDLSLVFNYCLGKQQFKIYKRKNFAWEMVVKWEDLCNWIESAPVSSLGSNLDISARRELSIHMRNWLAGKGINLSNNIKIKWGFRITWLLKTV